MSYSYNVYPNRVTKYALAALQGLLSCESRVVIDECDMDRVTSQAWAIAISMYRAEPADLKKED